MHLLSFLKKLTSLHWVNYSLSGGAFFIFAFSMGQMDKFWEFPPSPPPPHYGNVLINRVSEKNDRLPVSFSHWLHRVEYTCRVCHFELGFEMKVNSTEITMEKIKKGEYCGACHNGEIAFSPARGNCRKCHNGNLSYSDDKFKKLDYLPKSQYGNGINWTKAIMWGLIRPKESLINPNFKRIPFNEVVELEPEWSGVLVDAYFPHEEHSVWLDCADCHPDVFNIQKKGTKNFLMQYILEGKFCGYCHLNVAFPINECRKCHPMMKE